MKHQMIAVALVSVFACLFVGCSSGDSSTRHVSDAGTAGEDSESSPGKSGGNSGSSGENSDFQDGGSSGASGEQSISGGGSDLSDGGSLSGGGNDFSGGGSSVAGESNVAGSGDAGSGGSAGENVGGTTGVGGSSACTSIPLPEPSDAKMTPFSCTEFVRDTAFDSLKGERWGGIDGVLALESGEVLVAVSTSGQEVVASYDPEKDEWSSVELPMEIVKDLKGSFEEGIWIAGKTLTEAPSTARWEDGVWVEHNEGLPIGEDEGSVSDMYVVAKDEAYAIVGGWSLFPDSEGLPDPNFRNRLFRWDGRAWFEIDSPYVSNADFRLTYLWGDGSSSFVITGKTDEMNSQHIFRYDGCTFTDFSEYLPAYSLFSISSVSGNADGEIYVTGMFWLEDENKYAGLVLTAIGLMSWTTHEFPSISEVTDIASSRMGAAVGCGKIPAKSSDGSSTSNVVVSVQSEGVLSDFTPVDNAEQVIIESSTFSLAGDRLVVTTGPYSAESGLYRATCR